MLRKVFTLKNVALAIQVVMSVTIAEARNWNIAISEISPGSSLVNGHYRIPLIENPQANLEGNVHASGVLGGHNNGHMSIASTLSGRHRPSGIVGSIKANPSLRGAGTTVSGNAKFPIAKAPYGYIGGNVHGYRVFGGPLSSNNDNYGGGITYALHKGIYGGVDVTSGRLGNTYSANIGAEHKVGPGTVSLTGEAQKTTYSDDLDGQIWIQYEMPFSTLF